FERGNEVSLHPGFQRFPQDRGRPQDGVREKRSVDDGLHPLVEVEVVGGAGIRRHVQGLLGEAREPRPLLFLLTLQPAAGEPRRNSRQRASKRLQVRVLGPAWIAGFHWHPPLEFAFREVLKDRLGDLDQTFDPIGPLLPTVHGARPRFLSLPRFKRISSEAPEPYGKPRRSRISCNLISPACFASGAPTPRRSRPSKRERPPLESLRTRR